MVSWQLCYNSFQESNMPGKRSELGGLAAGSLVLALGLAMIFAKDWVWSLFLAFYSLLGIQTERTRMWEMFITTIGLGIAALGLYVILIIWIRRRNDG
jgi:hypothetical protein